MVCSECLSRKLLIFLIIFLKYKSDYYYDLLGAVTVNKYSDDCVLNVCEPVWPSGKAVGW